MPLYLKLVASCSKFVVKRKKKRCVFFRVSERLNETSVTRYYLPLAIVYNE